MVAFLEMLLATLAVVKFVGFHELMQSPRTNSAAAAVVATVAAASACAAADAVAAAATAAALCCWWRFPPCAPLLMGRVMVVEVEAEVLLCI